MTSSQARGVTGKLYHQTCMSHIKIVITTESPDAHAVSSGDILYPIAPEFHIVIFALGQITFDENTVQVIAVSGVVDLFMAFAVPRHQKLYVRYVGTVATLKEFVQTCGEDITQRPQVQSLYPQNQVLMYMKQGRSIAAIVGEEVITVSSVDLPDVPMLFKDSQSSVTAHLLWKLMDNFLLI